MGVRFRRRGLVSTIVRCGHEWSASCWSKARSVWLGAALHSGFCRDLLVDYISKTTALNLSDFLASRKGEVNIISGGYGDNVDPLKRRGEFALVDDVKLYSGPVSSGSSSKKSFSDIIKLGGTPDIAELWKKLIQKKPCGSFVC